ncbi:hypothetical protein Y1Q_0013600 [Alligator mississippiensis]|uniref:Uncharacterized protein n=1 Tax=Alligator mississippiensis TaxID=8496 RepID=A0A151P3E9_ALLMI|nr:hypothetical protein Y1Q_0013600 [Alligator mississippiensis]
MDMSSKVLINGFFWGTRGEKVARMTLHKKKWTSDKRMPDIFLFLQARYTSQMCKLVTGAETKTTCLISLIQCALESLEIFHCLQSALDQDHKQEERRQAISKTTIPNSHDTLRRSVR